MKPLYLDGKEPLPVALDGPALRVSTAAESDRRFPLCRISRVTVSGRVSWSTEALLACADEGITVCFLKSDGGPRARWIGRPSKRSEFAQRWRDFFDRPDCDALYADWRRNIRRRALRFCALRLGWSPNSSQNIVAMLMGGIESDISELREFKREIRGLAHSRCLQELTKIGLGSDDTTLASIVPDLVMVIQWGLHPDFITWWQGQRRALIQSNLAVSFFERHRNTCDFHLRDTLRSLNHYLKELE